MTFAADRMLGRLAKWLRLLGYDTVYSKSLSDEEFLALRDQGRILLTRNTSLAKRLENGRLVFVHHNDTKVQLQEVIHTLGLKPEPRHFFTRCIICNEALKSVEGEDVVGRVPEYVWSSHNDFSECTTCGKIYWPGSHLGRSRQDIRRILGV